MDADALYGQHLGYGYYGYPYAHHGYQYGKRSADEEPKDTPEAEPALLYGAYQYGGYDLPNTGNAYDAYRPYGRNGAYPYAYGGFGKRSADADPTVLAGGSRVISAPTPLIHNVRK